MAVTSPQVLVGNILIAADSDFESGSTTWAAGSGSNTPSVATTYSFSGTHSLKWTASSTADSFINTGYYPCIPNNGYGISGYVLTPNNVHDTYIGVTWYTSAHAVIGTVWGADNVTVTNLWEPLVGAVTSPSNAAYFKLTVWVGTGVVANEPFAIDLMYAADVPAVVWTDWFNPAFTSNSIAGDDFMDMTPFIRFDQNIAMTSGRQDAVSEIQTGTASFFVQNDNGWFTPQLSTSPFFGYISLGARTQVNIPDEVGGWHTRFDGPISQITYTVDGTGGTNLANISCSDVLAYMNRQNPMQCWTLETVMNNNPWLHWTLNDSGNDNSCLETSGNNGPVLHLVDSASGAEAPAIAWQSTAGGVETLADAVGPGTPDGSAGWMAGSVVPQSPIRGLIPGTSGPYSTPLPSVHFTPAFTAQSAENLFLGTDGYQFNAQLYIGSLPTPIITNTVGVNYSIECWFTEDPGIKTNLGHDYGPFTIISLGSGKRPSCLCAGLYYSGASNLNIELVSYAQPPSFPMTSFGSAPSVLQSATATMPIDSVPLPHHLVVQILGSAGTGTAQFYLDGVLSGSISLPAGQIFDTFSVGGAYGDHGCFYGNISCVSIYNYQLSPAQITTDCMVGQYGYWEQTTDNCVAAIANLSGLPPFWNNVSAQNDGLSLTEYQNISGSTPLAAMQLYEQAEHGLLFINRSGQLTFHTRDWRMGYGTPDLSLPPNVADADLGYELVDTYLINESAIGTTVFTSGVASINQGSSNQYGTYANGNGQSPIQLPLITWNRSYMALGLTAWGYWQDPNLTDNAAWQTNTRSTPRLICGQLNFDLLSLDPTSMLYVSTLYGLDIDNMVSLADSVPSSFPDQPGALDYFIEGINETIGAHTHTMVVYTSPATVQRAWRPGDSQYGKLGTTTRLGISDPDLSVPPALGKDVAHDGGPPYWPPAFQTVPGGTQLGFNNITTQNPTIIPTFTSVTGDCLLVQVQSPSAATISVADTEGNSYSQIASVSYTGGVQYLFAAYNCFPVNPNDTITITTSASQNYTTSLYRIWGISGMDATAKTTNGTSTTPSITGNAMNPTSNNDFELVIVANSNTEQLTSIPSGWTQLWYNYNGVYRNQLFWRQATSSSADAFSGTFNGSSTGWGAIALSFYVTPWEMNNPANNGSSFIGAADIRGIRDNLSMALNPPLLVVGAVNDQQTYTTGNGGLGGRLVWDTVFVDTVGGMGIVPGWPNWYCVMVPGVYEINGDIVWAAQASGAAGIRSGWIIIAQHAAQLVAEGAGTPQSGTTWVCPIGEQVTPNNASKNPNCVPSTRVYLGVGDMVGLGGMHTQGTNLTTGTGAGGSLMSIRWLGWNTASDQTPVCAAPGSGGVSYTTSKTTYVKTYSALHTYSYWGTFSSNSPQLRQTDGTIWTGEQQPSNGSQFSFATFNYSQIASDTSGATIINVQLTMQNNGSSYGTGADLMVGWTTSGTFGSTFVPAGGTRFDWVEKWFKPGATQTVNIGLGIGQAFQSSGATALAFGNNSTTNLAYHGSWVGAQAPQLIITYQK